MQTPTRATRKTSPPTTPPTMAPIREGLSDVGRGWGEEAIGECALVGNESEEGKHDEALPEETTNEVETLATPGPTASISYTPGVTLTGFHVYVFAVAATE